jgi:hypothetical protein
MFTSHYYKVKQRGYNSEIILVHATHAVELNSENHRM